MTDIILEFNKSQMKKKSPNIKVGDTVSVSQKVKEGDKIRSQVFEGVIVAFEKPNSLQATIRVRKISAGIGVEKTFLLHSPWVEKIEVKKGGHARRAKLYYLRGLVGKAATRLKGKERELSTFEEELVEEAAKGESVQADERPSVQEIPESPELPELPDSPEISTDEKEAPKE